MNFAKFLRAPFLQNTSGRLLLKVVTAKLFVLCDRSIYVPSILFVLTLPSDVAVLYGNVVLSILLLSAKKRYSSFLKKVSFSKVNIENFKVSTRCHKKTCRSLCMWYEYAIKERNLINFVDMNKDRSNQAAIQLSKTQLFPVSTVNNVNQSEKHR